MPRFAAFLRAINVGGRRLTNDELREHFEALGFGEAEIYQAAGNVAFESRVEDAALVATALDSGLSERLGYECTAFVRSTAELQAITASEPFGAEAPGKIHIAFLPFSPEEELTETALAFGSEADRLVFGERELYWLTPGGVKEAAIDLIGLEKLIGPWTMRTKGTLERFVAKHFSGA